MGGLYSDDGTSIRWGGVGDCTHTYIYISLQYRYCNDQVRSLWARREQLSKEEKVKTKNRTSGPGSGAVSLFFIPYSDTAQKINFTARATCPSPRGLSTEWVSPSGTSSTLPRSWTSQPNSCCSYPPNHPQTASRSLQWFQGTTCQEPCFCLRAIRGARSYHLETSRTLTVTRILGLSFLPLVNIQEKLFRLP